jgi:hypothetical protein
MLCPECRTENPDDRAACAECGSALTASPSPTHQPSNAVLVRREIGVIVVGLTAIALSLFGAWYVLVRYRSPETIVRRFIDADIQGRFAEQNRYVVEGWSSTLTLSVFQEIRKQLGRSPFENSRIAGSSVHGSTADVEVEVPAPSLGGRPAQPATPVGNTVDITFSLERRGDEWRIQPEQTAASAAAAYAALGWRASGFKLPGGLALPPLPNPGSGPTTTPPSP